MRGTARAWLAAVACAATSTAAAEGPGTLRLDFFHTGGRGIEAFAVDRVVLEPLPWPGNPARTVDAAELGDYRFEVRDPAGQLLYARGYGAIYGEWITTAEAAQQHRTFHESLRFPVPAGPVEITVLRRGDDNRFAAVWRTAVDPADPYLQRASPARQQLITVEQHGAPADKVDVLLVGDGYTAAECAAKFGPDARRMADALFRHEPFAARRGDFNVWGLCPPAEQSGIARPSTGIQRRSPVGSTYDVFGSERYVLTFDNRALRDVAAWAPYEFITILVNGATYGGGGIFGLFSTVAVDNEWADYLFVHEFGHHFAGLADEYYTSPVAYQPAAQVVEPWQSNVTALLDGAPPKWHDLVAAGTPWPTPWPKAEFEARQREFQARRKQLRADNRPESEMNALFREERAFNARLFAGVEFAGKVGAFRGANYDAQAFYRPQLDCVMFTRDEVPFCRVCQRALEQVIDLYAGPRPTR
ncbi:MAG TPA: M64 family metallopeptidase [Burkholderiales bacterium]|nr:M64 family metallopeptidase [Burkholderiales bacterium]